ncbi:MAG: hypothetical protein MI919_02355, partial [Holophagales bacterium]|nr:hypothetical protein [Holophagales bacterium]
VDQLAKRPPPPIPPDPRPRLESLEDRAEQLTQQVQQLERDLPNLLELEGLAIAELRPKILKKLDGWPFLQSLQKGDPDTRARASLLTTTFPKSLEGELAREAEALVQTIREAWNLVSGIETLDKHLSEQGPLQTVSRDTETVGKNLFRLRDHSFRLHALLHTDQGERWKDFRLEDWVRTRFRRFADELYREHWQRRLDGRGDDLGPACELADEILRWGDLEVIRTEPGITFDSRVHIGLSTASNPNLGDGAIAGIVRVGFRDLVSGQVIQQPEVIVNRR